MTQNARVAGLTLSRKNVTNIFVTRSSSAVPSIFPSACGLPYTCKSITNYEALHYAVFSSFLTLSYSYNQTIPSIHVQSNYLQVFMTMVCVTASNDGKYLKFQSQDSICFSCIHFTNFLSCPKEHNFLYHPFHQLLFLSQGT